MRKKTNENNEKREFMSELPRITMLGSGSLFVENFKALIICTDQNIKLSTLPFLVNITGKDLEVKSITPDIIEIGGEICDLSIEK